MSVRDVLAPIVASLPPGSSVTFPVDVLRGWLDADATETTTRVVAGEASADLTVEKVGQLLDRSPSTIRQWVRDGLLPGAYLLRGKQWRVPSSAIDAFQKAEAERGMSPVGDKAQTHPDYHAGPVNLSSWRELRGKGGR